MALFVLVGLARRRSTGRLREMRGLASRRVSSTDWHVLSRLEVAWTPAAHNNGSRMYLAYGDLCAGSQCRHNLESDDKVLLQLLPTAVVRRCNAKLQPLPADGEADIIRIHVLAGGEIERIGRGFLFGLVLHGRGACCRCLPRHGYDLDRVAFQRLCGRNGQLLTKNGELVALIGQDVLQVPRQGDGASDLKEIPTIARQLRWWRLYIARSSPGRLGEKEHAVELGSHGDGDALHRIAEDGVGHVGEGEAEQLVVALNVGALGHAILVVWVDGLLVAALDIGEGVLVGGGEALEVGRGLLQVVGGEGIFATASLC